jgi:AraC-like DNA-binding protein
MASTTINNIRFVYPDSPCFVFNPVPVRALPVGQGVVLDRLHLEMTGSGGDSFEVTYSMRYTATVDISEYLQGLYTGMLMGADIDYTSQSGYSEMGQSVTIVAKALNAAGTVIAQCTFTLFTIWGGLKAGEIFNQHRTVTWFKNYPFTIGYYADHLCVTAKYLSEVSKKVSGLPANYWITRYTALDISRCLRDRSLRLTDIADMFGFSSMSHFTRYVVNNLGAKPSDFRE